MITKTVPQLGMSHVVRNVVSSNLGIGMKINDNKAKMSQFMTDLCFAKSMKNLESGL